MNKGEIEIYRSEGGTEIQVRLEQNTIWLDAHLMAELFGVQRQAVIKHIRNIFKSGELNEKASCSKMELFAADHKMRQMNLYNLDVIISVGYRINSTQATLFRQWATQRLKDYLIQGYATNEKRLAQKQQEVQHMNLNLLLLKNILPDSSRMSNIEVTSERIEKLCKLA